MRKNIHLTIFIPAFNEEANIANLLTSILAQKKRGFELDNILIISDGSTDSTTDIVKSFKSKKIKLVEGKSKLGKNRRINEVFKNFRGRYLIQIDADSVLKGKFVISKLAKKLSEGNDLVCGYHEPIKPKTRIEKFAFFGSMVWELAKKLARDGGQKYFCIGQLRGFSKKYIRQFRLPENKYTMEDVYSFLFAKANNLQVAFAKDALVYFKLPSTLSDYTTQMKRFLKTGDVLKPDFPESLLLTYDTVTRREKFLALLMSLNADPINGLGFFMLQLYTRILTISYKQKLVWETSTTTRKVASLL